MTHDTSTSAARPRPSRRLAALRRAASPTLTLLLGAALVTGQLSTAVPSSTGASERPDRRAVRVVDGELRLVGASVATRVERALRTAMRQRGDRYKYGAEGPDRFDCSGLVWFATHKAGFDDVPRTSAEQGRHMRHIKRKKMRPGDFVFFTGSSGVYHVGVYVGKRDGGRAIVHAPKPGTKVRVEKVWTDSWFAGTLRR